MLESYASRLLVRHLQAAAGVPVNRRDTFEGVLLLLDIVGSTAMSEQFAGEGTAGAEKLARILNLYFGDVFDLVAAHGGDTVRIEGDAVLALWHGEAAALRAAQAAVALRDAFIDWRPGIGVRVRHRLALGRGTMTAASFRVPGQRSFFALIGDAVRATTLLSQGAEPGEIVLTPALARELDGIAELRREASGVRLLSLPDAPSVTAPAPAHGDSAGLAIGDFLPRMVVERSGAGLADWLAEFRMVSMVYTQLTGVDVAAAATFELLQELMVATTGLLHGVGLSPTELAVGDKGIVLLVASGVPPSAQENNAVRALEAATRIHALLRERGWAGGVGVASGRAFCGDVGSATRREYLVTGPVMYRGARLMQHAAGGVLVDGPTAQATGGHFAFSPPELLRFKGIAEPLPVHHLLERQRARPPSPARALHGRQQERQLLLDQLDGPPGAAGRVAAVLAEPGAGKSLLLAHVESAARSRGQAAIAAAASPVDRTSPYFIWRALLPQLVGATELPQLRLRLLEALQGSPLAAKAGLLEDILPLGLSGHGLARQISGAARVTGIEDLVVRVAARAGARQRLVLLVDDLHWIDNPSARLLLALVRRVPGVLLVLASRDVGADTGPHAELLLAAAATRIKLEPLAADSLAGLVCDALGVSSIPERLLEFVVSRSEGLPLHAEQLVLSLRDRRLVEVADGRCRVTASELPWNDPGHRIEDVIVSRIDLLDQPQQLAMKVASTIGRVFDLDTLRHIYPVPADEAALPQILDSLAAAGLLEPAGAGLHSFRHRMIRDITHDLVLHEKRAELHRRIADYLEQRHAGDLDERFAELAEHLEQGRQPERAVVYRGQAAEAALRRHANHDALSHLDRIERLATQSGLQLPLAQQGRLARIRADACHALSRFQEAGLHFRACADANGISIPSGRTELLVGIAAEMSRQLLRRCGLARAVPLGPDQDRGRLAAHIHARLSEQAYFAGDAPRILYGTLASLNSAERVGAVHETIEGYGAMAIGLGTAGMHRAGRFYRARSLAHAEQSGVLEGRGIAHLFAAVYSYAAGDWDATLSHTRAGAAVCGELGDRFRQQTCVVLEAHAELELGNYAHAGELLQSFGADAEAVENAAVRAWIFCGRATLDLLLGRAPALALAHLQAARDERLNRAEILLCDGLEVAARQAAGEAEAAQRAAQRALASMIESAPTTGILGFSVGACADFFLARAEGAASPQLRQACLRTARQAADAARAYAAKTRIFRPHALLVEARYAHLLGREDRARRCVQRALAQAQQLRLPLEQALAHLRLADLATGAARTPHNDRAATILQRLGVDHPLIELGPVAQAPAPQSMEATRAA